MQPQSHRLVLALLVALVVPLSADAQTYYTQNASAGAACHPANGGAAARFVRANYTLTNNNTTDQYAVCHLPMQDTPGLTYAPLSLSIHVGAGNTGGTFVCAAQTGSYTNNNSTVIHSSSAQQATVLAFTNAWLEIDTSKLARSDHKQVLVLNCRLPPGGKLGLIEWVQGQ